MRYNDGVAIYSYTLALNFLIPLGGTFLLLIISNLLNCKGTRIPRNEFFFKFSSRCYLIIFTETRSVSQSRNFKTACKFLKYMRFDSLIRSPLATWFQEIKFLLVLYSYFVSYSQPNLVSQNYYQKLLKCLYHPKLERSPFICYYLATTSTSAIQRYCRESIVTLKTITSSCAATQGIAAWNLLQSEQEAESATPPQGESIHHHQSSLIFQRLCQCLTSQLRNHSFLHSH